MLRLVNPLDCSQKIVIHQLQRGIIFSGNTYMTVNKKIEIIMPVAYRTNIDFMDHPGGPSASVRV